MAANADVRFGTEHPTKDLHQNTIATVNVLEAMRTKGVKRIAFTLTGSVYGEPDVFPTPENAPFPVQTSLYAASKRRSGSSGKSPADHRTWSRRARRAADARRQPAVFQRSRAPGDAEVVWVAYDTPVDDQDQADVDYVLDRVRSVFADVKADVLFLVSSQLPAASTRVQEEDFAALRPSIAVSFAYSPENLRLGSALDVFLRPASVPASRSGIRRSDPGP